jgi:hypothetical protein
VSRRLEKGFGTTTRDELLSPYRALALRVISLALQDLVTPGHAGSERDTARAFFSGSRMLSHWCRLADLDPVVIREKLRFALERGRRAHRHEGH